MSGPNKERTPLNGQLRGTGRRAARSSGSRPVGLGSLPRLPSGVPCGACKYLRRKCVNGCIFAPHFGTEQGTALFAAIHKVFGASNLSKLLAQLPMHQRHYAVQSFLYEAQARLNDPVCGCVSDMFGLVQQVLSLETKLKSVQSELRAVRAENIIQGQGPLQMNNLAVLPGHHNMVNMNMFDPNHPNAVYAEPVVDPLLFTGPYFNGGDGVEGTEDPFVFGDKMF